MKKVVLMVLCCIMLSVAVCSAEISRKSDEFTGGGVITSKFFIGYSMKELLDCISFSKTMTKNADKYSLQTDVTTIWEIPYRDIKINIDGDYTFDLVIINRNHWVVRGEKFDRDRYIVNYNILNNIVEKIKSANRVALQCAISRRSGNQFVYVLPDNVLAEWKQVITTEK